MGTRGLSRCAAVLALLALAAVAATSAGAQRSALGAAPHLLSVPAQGAPAAALARTDARPIARYGAFTLVRAAGDDAERLLRAGADLRDDMREVELGRGRIDPARDRAPLSLRQRAPDAHGLALVQLTGPIKDAWLERLRATGVRVVTYMAENGYLVSGSFEELSAVSALVGADPAFRALVDYTPADKLGAGVRARGRQRLAVQTLTGPDGAAARRRVDELGTELRATSAVGPFRTRYAELDAARAAELASDPGVVSIQPTPEPRLYDEIADQIVAGALSASDPLVPTGPGYLGFHDGLGLGAGTFPFVVDVTDEGFDTGDTAATGHPDFHVGGDLANPSRVAYADDFTSDTDARDCGGHGTINASIIGGFDSATGSTVEDAGGFNYGLGVAPRTQLGATKVFRCSNGSWGYGGTLADLASGTYAKGARIANHSWGANTGGAYTADSQAFDALVRDAQSGTAGNQQMVEVIAAGNAGSGQNTVGSPGTAKNVITVGASENVRGGTDGCGWTSSFADDARDIATFSSRGPTDDLRTKPDVVGPGTHVTGSQSHASGYDGSGVCALAFPAGSTLYTWSTGTSHSTPVLSGMAAVFREWFRQKKGGLTAVPSPALTKAAIANAATDLAGGAGAGTGVPNSSQGWGLGNMARLLDTGPRFFWDQQTTFGSTGASFQRTLAVQDPSKPVRVTLAWTDRFGPTSGASYVNNLDLGVSAGSGAFKGNVFSGGVSVPGGNADPRNNLEGVYLPAGTSGSFSVSVTAANIAGDGVPGNADVTDQDFALVVSNAAVTGGPPPAPGQPTGLVAVPGQGSISLDWDDTPGATSYEVFRRTGGGDYPAAPVATTGSSSFVDAGLAAGQQYCYRVGAVNQGSRGPLSAELCATTPTADTGSGGAPFVDLSLLPSSVRVGRHGVFRLRIRGTPNLAGSLTLRTVRAVATASGRRRLVVARRSFTMPASGRVRLRVRLNRRGFRVLKRERRLRVSARVRLGPAGARRRLTLRAPPRR